MFSRRAFLAQAALLAAGAGAAFWLRDKVFWAPPSVAFAEGARSSGWLDFGRNRRDPLVTVLAGIGAGVPVRALIDSGAQASVIDRDFARRHGLGDASGAPMIAYGVGGDLQVARGVRLSVTLGALSLRDLNAAAVELGPVAEPSNLGIGLILGQDVLSRLVTDIDFRRRQVAFADPAAFARPEGLHPAPVRRQGRALVAEVHVEERPLDVVLDTGATGALSLTRAAAEEVGLLDELRPSRQVAIVLGGTATGLGVATAETLRFGRRTWRDVEVAVFNPPPAPGFPKGLLGIEALKGGRAVLDLGAGRLDLI